MSGIRAAAKALTRELVLSAARTAFAARGYESVHIRDLASSISRSTGSVFANFASKEALFEAAMGRPAPDVKWFLRGLANGSLAGSTALGLAAQLAQDLYGPDTCCSG